jgi:hypothetical protein
MSKFSPFNLNLSKLHSWRYHLISSIRQFGAINGFTSETYELLHKINVKQPYRMTNKRHVNTQMQSTVSIIFWYYITLIIFNNIFFKDTSSKYLYIFIKDSITIIQEGLQ